MSPGPRTTAGDTHTAEAAGIRTIADAGQAVRQSHRFQHRSHQFAERFPASRVQWGIHHIGLILNDRQIRISRPKFLQYAFHRRYDSVRILAWHQAPVHMESRSVPG